LEDDVPTELSSSVFLAASRWLTMLRSASSSACSDGRLATRGRGIAMTSGQSTVPQSSRFDHSFATEPGSVRATRVYWRTGYSTAGETSHPGGKKSLRHRNGAYSGCVAQDRVVR